MRLPPAFLCYLVQAWTGTGTGRPNLRRRPAPRAGPGTREHHGAGSPSAGYRPWSRTACPPCLAAAARDRTGHHTHPRHWPWPAVPTRRQPPKIQVPARWPLTRATPSLEIVISHSQHIRRLAGVLAGLAGAVLAFAAAAPAALASQLRPDPPGWLRRWALPVHLPPGPSGLFKHPPLPPGQVAGPVPVYQVPAHTAVTGGMPGWQIALIAAGAALAAATVLVLPDRAGRMPEDAHGGYRGEAPAQVTRAISGPTGRQAPTQRSR